MKKSVFFLFVLLAVFMSACASESPAATEAPAQSDSAVPTDKCEWLRQNFPQTTEAIQSLGAKLAGVVPERVRTHVYRCTPDTTVFDGLIILGPNEGYSGKFTITVPVGGAVDSYASAVYTGRHELLGAATDTMRAFDGKVTATTVTYWPWLDENPPVSSSSLSDDTPSDGTSTCIDPVKLAKMNGWAVSGSPDKYGGLVVTIDRDGANLPSGWMANYEGGSIGESDGERTLAPWKVATIYPPYGECRNSLGYTQ